MKLLNIQLRSITNEDLINFIEKEKCISREVYSPLLNQYEVLVENWKKPARKAIYCGMNNYLNNGAFIYNWFKKTGVKKLDEVNPIVLNYPARKCLLFSDIWDLLSYLNIYSEVQDKIKENVCLIVIAGVTKRDFRELGLSRFAKVGSCFKRDEDGDRQTRNFLKVYTNGIDIRNKELVGKATSLNDVLKGDI